MTTENMTETKLPKRRFKAFTKLYLWLTIIGIVLIGIGSGVAIFELSEYKMINYRASTVDSTLPPIEMQTITLEATYEKGEQFKLDAYNWNITQYDIQHDNTLKDKVLIEVNAPKDLYHVYLLAQSENHYVLQCDEDTFSIFRYTLDLAKDKFILEFLPPVTIKLTMNETQAKNFKLNEERYKAQEATQDYQEQLNDVRSEYNEQLNQIRNDYTEQLNEQRNEYTAQINQMQEEYNDRLHELQGSYETQMEETREEYERRIAELEMQLTDARNALS